MDLHAAFAEIQARGFTPPKRGRPPDGERALTQSEYKHKYRSVKREARLRNIAVLDFETDPFTNEREEIYPFCCELYSDQFGAIAFWDEDYESLIDKVFAAIEALPDSYTIYAHNGGKFDFMYFVHKLRGTVKFKGRAIMSARVGNHEIRDSLHILPEKLSAWKKDKFSYQKMHKHNRNKYREEILAYQHSDCVYLFDFIKRFTKEFGISISIGQAAFRELKKHYQIAPIKESMDTALREYFIGGRVECVGGLGLFESHRWQKPYRLYDVNSMYPFVMATRKHPIGREYVWHRGLPNENTVFLDLSCRSYGAMFTRLETGELVPADCHGRFKTTIWEYETALKYDLIEDVQIHWCIDNLERTDFSKFILPMYARREETKEIMQRLKDDQTCDEYEETKKENIFLKYLQNNSYGKTAQNPRRFKEYYYVNHGEMPPKEWFEFIDGADADTIHTYSMPVERTDKFDVWARPSPGRRYNNVGTGASITGAARAVLLEAKVNALDPIYCDTDSLICRELVGVEIDAKKLGAWDIEETFDEVIIIGKKTYACSVTGKGAGDEKRLKVRSKGADLRIRPCDRDGIELLEPSRDQWEVANAATWKRYLGLLDGEIITAINRAPTFSKIGQQNYLTRRIRATAPLRQRQGIASYARGIQNRR